jgi:hypothetical protein
MVTTCSASGLGVKVDDYPSAFKCQLAGDAEPMPRFAPVTTLA